MLNVEVEIVQNHSLKEIVFQVRVQYALETCYIDFPVEYLNYKSMPVDELFAHFEKAVESCTEELSRELTGRVANDEMVRNELHDFRDDIRDEFQNRVEDEVWYCDFCGEEQRYSEVANAWFCPICEWED